MANKNAVAENNQNEVKEETKMADQNQVKPEENSVNNPPAADNTQNLPAPEPPKEGWLKRHWKKIVAAAGGAAALGLGLFAAEKYGEGRGACKAIASLPVSIEPDYDGSDDTDVDLDDIPDADITEI